MIMWPAMTAPQPPATGDTGRQPPLDT